MSSFRMLVVPAVCVAASALLPGGSWARTAADDPLCGKVVTASLKLTANLHCDTRPGLVVGKSGITINLNGFTIQGAGQDAIGIHNIGHDNVRILNGTISRFKWGILIQDDADTNTVKNVAVRSNTLDGLLAITGSDTLTLTNVRALNNDVDGISLTDSTGHVVSASNATSNEASGFELINASNVTLSVSTASLNEANGILAQGASTGLAVSRSTAARNALSGILLQGDQVDGANLLNVTASGNGIDGVNVEGADGTRVTRAIAIGNSAHGVSVSAGADGTVVNETTAIGNPIGIRTFDADTLLQDNRADGNGTGISAVSTANDGGGNTARGNFSADCSSFIACG